METIYKLVEVAEILKANPEVVRRWLKSGKLRGTKPAGDEWRIRESDLNKFLNNKS